jgi:Fe-S-cluster containining protein
MCNCCGECCRFFRLDIPKGKGIPVLQFSEKFEEFLKVRGSWRTVKSIKVLDSKEDLQLQISEPCIHLEGKLCGIHEIKPEFCREFDCAIQKNKKR